MAILQAAEGTNNTSIEVLEWHATPLRPHTMKLLQSEIFHYTVFDSLRDDWQIKSKMLAYIIRYVEL